MVADRLAVCRAIRIDIINSMRAGTVVGVLLLAPPLCALAQNDLAPELLTLARIKVKAAENLNRLPNYTCIETIERSRRRAPTRRYELVDTVRLEVAVVGGKELFAWPGGGQFQDGELSKMVPGGAIGNGNFALHARSVFLSHAAMFTAVGERIRDERRTIRYDYRVPRMLSGYQIRIGEVKGIVGYHGSFWVDADSLDLIRLEVNANEIPPELPVQSAVDGMDYARVSIGGSDFLLPQSSELIMTDLSGNESRNRTTFSGCRQYAGESVLSFAEPPPEETKQAVTAVEAVTLPAGLVLDISLETEIDSARSAVGDPVTARVTSRVKREGSVIVPKGAMLSGRITRLDRRRGSRSDYYSIGFTFSQIEFENKRSAITGTLLESGTLMTMRTAFRQSALSNSGPPDTPNTFYVQGERVRVVRGHRFTWRIEQQP